MTKIETDRDIRSGAHPRSLVSAAKSPAGLVAWLEMPVGLSRIVLWSAVLFLPFLLLLFVNDRVFVNMHLVDTFMPLNGAMYLRAGMIPHVDFGTPLGFMFFVPYAAAMALGVDGYKAIDAGAALAALPIILLAAWVARARFSGFWALVFVALCGFEVITPRVPGEFFNFMSHAAAYNRIGWAFLCILMLLCLVPARNYVTRGLGAAEGVVAGVLLFVLFYWKMNYFAVGAVSVAVSLFFWRWPAKRIAWTGATFFGGILAVELSLGLNLAYANDILTAMRVSLGGFRIGMFAAQVITSGIEFLAIGVIVLLSFAASRGTAWPSRHDLRLLLQPALIIAWVCLAGLLVANQNQPSHNIPLLVLAALMVFAFMQRNEAASFGQRAPMAILGAGAIALGIALRIILPDAMSIVAHAYRSLSLPVMTDALAGTRIGSLANKPGEIDAAAFERESRDSPMLRATLSTSDVEVALMRRVFADGLSLLRPRLRPQERVMTLAEVNPFPFALGTVPPRGVPLDMRLDSFVLETAPPPPEKLFADTDVLMLPRFFHSSRDLDTFTTIYRDAIAEMFKPVARSTYWQMYRKAPRRDG